MDEIFAIGIALAGSILGALSSGAIGLGFPIVAIPTIALGFGLDTAVVVTALPAFAIDFSNLRETWDERKTAQRLVRFGVIAGVGAIIGSTFRTSIDERVLVVILLLAIGSFILGEVTPRKRPDVVSRSSATSVAAPAFGGLLQSTVGISGPVMGTYLLNRTASRRSFIFHLTTMFVLIGAVRLASLTFEGSFTTGRLTTSLVLMAVGLGGRSLGFRLGSHLSQSHFRKAVVIVLAASLVPLTIQTF